MLKKITIALIVLASIAGCKSKSAFNYSQDFVKMEKALMPPSDAAQAKIDAFMKTDQYDSITAVAAEMESLVGKTVQEIKDKPAPDVKEGANFKEAGVKYFEYLKSIYTAYKAIGNSSIETRGDALIKLRTLGLEGSKVVEDIQAAQKKFADANGFRVETAK